MLRTMSMMKAGLALMASSLGAAALLVLLHADVLAAMTVMMFGPAMTGMVVFMLMLMEDSGGFMMTGSETAPMTHDAPDAEAEVLANSDGLLESIDAIAPAATGMDMAMTNAFTHSGAVLAVVFFMISIPVILLTPWPFSTAPAPLNQPFAIGSALLDKYMVAFEGAGLLILLAIAGATMLGRKEPADQPQ